MNLGCTCVIIIIVISTELRMILRKNNAFSLTEMLIVLVVISLLFAAMAPIVTKKHKGEVFSNGFIWNFVSFDEEYNSFFDPGVPQWTSSVYLNVVPENDNHAGKLVINAEDVDGKSQHHMQFRYGSGVGVNTANLLVKNNSVIVGPDSSIYSGSHSVGFGNRVLHITPKNSTNKNYSGTVAFGDNALAEVGNSMSGTSVIAIGANAGRFLSQNQDGNSQGGIFVGADAGSFSNTPYNTVAIGSHAMSNPSANPITSVFIGYNTGNGYQKQSDSDFNGGYNTIIGSDYKGLSAENNTIIGSGVYSNGDRRIKNMVAIGYGACDSISYKKYNSTDSINGGSRVCIGHNSAHSYNNSPESYHTDEGEHIFIGGEPQKCGDGCTSFSGRSVLELNRYKPSGSSTTDAVVVMNSNLVLRGNLYTYKDGDPWVVGRTNVPSALSTGYYLCSDNKYYNTLLNSYSRYICSSIGAEGSGKFLSENALYASEKCSGSKCPRLNQTSDIRLKTDITENNDGLSKVLQLEPYNYVFKSDKNNIPQVGVMAQDLQKVFPNSVKKSSDGYLKIRWDEMFYALVNAVKELNVMLQNAVAKLNNLNFEIEILQASNSNAKKKISELNARIRKLERK